MGRLLMLLSPAKSLDLGAVSGVLESLPTMAAKHRVLVAEVQKLGKAQLKTLLGTGDAITSLNYERYAGFDDQEAKQCCLAYDGPAYKGKSSNAAVALRCGPLTSGTRALQV
jgi:cytoplasmic iron level regulating protein YaaA (DUF328/UPF0246 family)